MTHICIYTPHIYIYTYIYILYIHIYVYACMHIDSYRHTQKHMHFCTYIYIYIYICLYKYKNTYTYTYIYISSIHARVVCKSNLQFGFMLRVQHSLRGHEMEHAQLHVCADIVYIYVYRCK